MVGPRAAEPVAGLGEIGLVDQVAQTRKAYEKALLALKDFYIARGTAVKTQWVDAELQAFNQIPKTQYLGVAELAGPNLKPLKRIDAADQLFMEGISFKNYPAFPPAKKDYLKTALEKFQTIIEKYPESDKIDEAAFRMGEIYGGYYFEDWARAVSATSGAGSGTPRPRCRRSSTPPRSTKTTEEPRQGRRTLQPRHYRISGPRPGQDGPGTPEGLDRKVVAAGEEGPMARAESAALRAPGSAPRFRR